MGRIKRPAKVQKGQKNYLTNERYQDYAENQFKTIYDFLDAYAGEVLFDNYDNSDTTITLLDDLSNYDNIEVYWKAERGVSWINGCEKVQNPNGNYFDVNTLYRSDATHQLGNTSLFKTEGNQITLISSSLYEINHNASPIFNSGIHVWITRVIGRKEK